MLTTDAALYLPISERLLGPVLNNAENFENAISGLSVSPVAALILLQYLPTLREHSSPSPGNIIAEAIKIGNERVTQEGLAAFTVDALRVLDRAKIQEGYELLPDFGIVLLDDEAVVHRNYLTAEGNWDYTFRERHRARLSESLQRIVLPSGEHSILTMEQGRIFREVRAQADDHLHVQGYAGTGKSYLIKSLLTMLQPTGARIMVLAERQQQLDALLAGMGQLGHVQHRTFGRLASEIVPQDLTVASHRHMRQRNYSLATMADDDVVRHLGISSCGGFAPREIVKAVRSTVVAFCFSGDDAIDANHIPDSYAASLDEATKQVVLHHATELWHATVSPPAHDFRPPVRDYHRVKWAALNRWQIPAHYTHVLIDECHDLAKPMLQILDYSPQAVISLGDEYQNLQGRPQQRSNVIRQREVTQSVRSGPRIEAVVNPIIAAHPGRTKLPFHGNPLNRVEIAYYGKSQVPEQPAVILVSDIWELFEWAQRLAESVDFELLSRPDILNMFVNDCIELYQHGVRPRHGELFRFGSWEAVASRHHANRGFQRIDRMIRKGYSYKDWLKTSARFVECGAQRYALGLVEDVRNREFDAVMLAPEVVERIWDAKHVTLAAAGSAIYVAVTRAQRRLIVPERLRNWIEEFPRSRAAGRSPN